MPSNQPSDSVQLPPQNQPAEKGVIGAMLRNPDVIPEVLDVLTTADFYYHHHSVLFQAMVKLRSERATIDLVSMHTELTRQGVIADIGGATVLADLWDVDPTGANAAYHAGIVRDMAVRRGLIHAANEILRDAYAGGEAAGEMAARSAKLVMSATDRFSSSSVVLLADAMREAAEMIDAKSLRQAGGKILRPTGFSELDRLTAGLHDGELITLAARPGVGKSALAVAFARAVCKADHTALFISLEMNRAEQSLRLILAHAGVSNERVRRGKITDEDAGRIATAMVALNGLRLWLDDEPHQTVMRIGATARKIARERPLGVIVVDYLQLIRPMDRRARREEQVAEMTRELKLLANAMKCPVLLLAQLNRESEKERRRPRLDDLRESGAVEQDSDCVLLLHPEREEGGHNEKLIEVIIAKQRNGPTGSVTLAYQGQFFAFKDYVPSA